MFTIASTLLFANLSLTAAPASSSDLPPVSRHENPGMARAQICHNIAADSSAVLSNQDGGDTLASNGIAYANRETCDRFVADFRVAANASPDTSYSDGKFKVGGRMRLASPISDCEGTRVDVRVYKKARGASSFATYANYVLQGDWVEPPGGISRCDWTVVSGSLAADAEPNDAGTETYRVAVKASKNGVAKPVDGWIRFNVIPG